MHDAFKELSCFVSFYLAGLDSTHQCVLQRPKDNILSIWYLLIGSSHLILVPRNFHDTPAIQYHKPLVNLPPKCDGCDALFSLAHFLICRRHGLVVQHHSEIEILLVTWRL